MVVMSRFRLSEAQDRSALFVALNKAYPKFLFEYRKVINELVGSEFVRRAESSPPIGTPF